MKAYTSGNYFYLIDDNGTVHESHSKNVVVHKKNESDTKYRFTGLVDWLETTEVDISDLANESDVAYNQSTFESFYQSSTGGSSTDNASFTGWADYTDGTYTTGSPLSLSTGVKITLPNDGDTIRDSQKPIDVASFYNPLTSKILGRNGDGLGVTLEFKVRPTTASVTKISVTIDIGGVVGEIYPRDFILTKGQNVEHYYLSSFLAYTLDTWESNGGEFKIVADAPAEVYDIRFLFHRTHKAR